MSGKSFGIELAMTAILFSTVWFANFAEAIAEAKSRGQASSLRAADKEEWVNAEDLRKGDTVRVLEGEYIPTDGEIIRGVATVNESAEAGTDHSGVIGGTKVLTGMIELAVANDPGNSFLDRMIGLVEGAQRQKTPNELALTVLLSALTAVFLIIVMTLPPMANFVGGQLNIMMLIALLVCLIPTTIGGLLPAIGIAGMNRALKANVVAKSGKAVEIAGDIDTLLLDKTGTITFGDRQATAFLTSQDSNDSALIEAAVLSSLEDPTPEGKSVLLLAKMQGYYFDISMPDAEFLPFSPKTRVSGLQLKSGETKIKGASDAVKVWASSKNIRWPDDIDALVMSVAQKGGTPLVVATDKQVLGVIALSDVIKPGVTKVKGA